jgi:hypothetical protein
MKPNVLFPLVLLFAGYSAQAADNSRPTSSPVSHFQGTCDSDPDGKKFAGRACYTRDNPADAGYGDEYQRPACDNSRSVTEPQRQLLAKTYVRAPDYMKGKLCRLTQIFVTEDTTEGPWGWGYWEGSDRPPGKGVYVAISGSELTATSSVAERENETVDLLLGVRGEKKKEARLARLRPQGASDPELAILGGLAHELGHALLADTNADGVDELHPRRLVSGPPQSSCFETAIIGTSWDPDRFHHNMTRWVAFGDQGHNRPKNRELRFNLNRLREQAERGRLDRTNDLLERIYRSPEFISPAAAIRPEEDFVETYKFKVLNDAAGGQPVEFRFGRQKVSVPDRLKSDVMDKKVECLRALDLLSGQP